MTVRDQYVLDYAEYLHSDPGLWRLTVDYLCTCGIIGKEAADQVLIRVPLNLHASSSKGKRREGAENTSEDMDDGQIEDGDLSGVVKELNATCFDYQREPVRRLICRVSASYLRLWLRAVHTKPVR